MRAPRVLRHLQGSSEQHGDTKLTVLLQTIADCPVRDICGMGGAAATGAVVYALLRHGVQGWAVVA